MREFPFEEIKLTENKVIRIFDAHNTTNSELIWHKDREDREVYIEQSKDWHLQLENEVPVKLETGQKHFIPAYTWHRLIMGKDKLIVEISKTPVDPKMAKYLEDHPYMEPDGLQEKKKKKKKFSKKERAKRAKKCDNPKGFTMKQFCKNLKTRSKKGQRKNTGKRVKETLELEEKVLKRGDEYVYVDKKGKVRGRHKTKKAAEKQAKAIFISRNVGENVEHSIEEKKKRDPKVGTGKKPKGSSRRLYTDENPKDTVRVKFSTVQDIRDTLSKSSFKSKSHKRQSQIINLIHQRVRAAYRNAKDPKVKKRLKKAYDYATKRKEASKRKTKRLRKEQNEPFQKAVKKNYRKMKIRLIGKGGSDYVSAGMRKPSYDRSKSAPPGFGGSLEEEKS